MPKHIGNAQWSGNLARGEGYFKLNAVDHDIRFTASSRFEDGAGSSPEELLGTAHAGCFSMAFSHSLAQAGFEPVNVRTKATVTLEKTDAGFTITDILLSTKGHVKGISKEKFLEIANQAKENCPVSRALKAVNVRLEAELEKND